MRNLPEAVELTPRVLRLRWPDGSVELPAADLRAACRCGSCRSRAERGGAWVNPELQLVDARPVGQYALNLSFSDGHDRGIYPWVWLRELAVGAAADAPRRGRHR